jgi:peptidyl-prolyl cis-trans isomerase C
MVSSCPRAAWIAALGSFLAVLPACNESAIPSPSADGGKEVAGLSAELASRPVAKVGDRTITLGDFARALERMDRFDRLRYEPKDRRRELLTEMINVELLAQEARRRGLDKDGETQDEIRQILRDALLAKSHEGLPTPATISDDEVRAYYEQHQDRFHEPERRRVAAIVMKDKAEAEKVLEEALKTKTANEWGELFFKHSMTAPKTRAKATPVDLAGDLGIVGPPDDSHGASIKVPEPVRAAVFTLAGVGSIGGSLVEANGRQYVIRMNGYTAPHHRTLAESDRSIRVLIIQEKMTEGEKALDDQLRAKFPVVVDDAALAATPLPATLEKLDMTGASMRVPPRPAATAAASAEAGAGGGAPKPPPPGAPPSPAPGEHEHQGDPD